MKDEVRFLVCASALICPASQWWMNRLLLNRLPDRILRPGVGHDRAGGDILPEPEEGAIASMPAILPDRLRAQVIAVVQAFEDPPTLVRRVIDVLEFYADRTRRPSRAAEGESVPWAYGAPGPVMRELKRAVQARAHVQTHEVWDQAEALWTAGYRETQIIAAVLAGTHAADNAMNWAQEKAPQALDGRVLEALGGETISEWRLENPREFLLQTSAWIESGEEKLRALGLAALTHAVDDARFEDIPSVFPLLQGLASMVQGEPKRQLAQLMRSLARRSPPEAARVLREERIRGGEQAHWLVKASLGAFPSRLQRELRRGLSRL